MSNQDDSSRVYAAFVELRRVLGELSFPFAVDSRESGRDATNDSFHQLDDYLLPRLESLDAPLLAVIGGSTGAGKSTLVNSILGEEIARVSAIRPTSHTPLLVCGPQDARWFEGARVLPGLARVSGKVAEPEVPNGQPITELRMATSSSVPPGLALLDSPDIDSVVTENRELAAQLLAAADLWIFVTTAARYADAIPWALLDEAAARNVVLAVVLNRVPNGAAGDIRPDLAARLEAHGLGAAPLFVIAEQPEVGGVLPADDVEPLRGWLRGLAENATARESVARQGLVGAVAGLLETGTSVRSAFHDQLEAASALAGALDDAFVDAVVRVRDSLSDGQLLRGEVLQRWQELVGVGGFTRALESGVASIRDHVAGWFTGRAPENTTARADEAIEDTLQSLLVSASELAIERVMAAWEETNTGAGLALASAADLRAPEERAEAAGQLVRDWQRSLLTMLEEEGRGRRTTARLASLGINAAGVALMIVLFAQTAGLTGGEVAIAGGTAVVAQKVLEALFGDDAVRRMATRARGDLVARLRSYFGADREPFFNQLANIAPDAAVFEALTDAYDEAERAVREGTL